MERGDHCTELTREELYARVCGELLLKQLWEADIAGGNEIASENY